jgi:tetratricopeptide (TPR) repeat protein
MSLYPRIAIFVSLIGFIFSNVYANPNSGSHGGRGTPSHGAATAQHEAGGSMAEDVQKMRTDWAIAKFQTPKNKQIPEFERLISRADAINQKYPHKPEVLLWYATTLSTYASIKGGLGVLPHVKKARALLEEAIRLNGQVENGLAYGVLGALYARVPGWPIAFGSKDKARSNLQKAIQISPNGIDSNYYYGDFLVDVGQYADARKHLDIAQRAPVRKEYEIQDRGRKEEIAASLAKLRRLGH